MLTLLVVSVSSAIVISAFCSIFEAVLYTLTTSQVELMKETHPRRAKIMAEMKENINQPITAILTLNTMAHTIGASVAGAAAVGVFGKSSLIWFSLCFTLAVLIFTEIIPKTIGVQYAKQLCPWITRPLYVMVIFMRPAIWLCQIITKLIPKNEEQQQVSSEELQTIAKLSLKSGDIGQDQELVISNILKLKEKTVRQVMTPRTVTFMSDKNITIKEAKLLEKKWRMHSRVPVYNGDIDEIEGIVLSCDMFIEAADNRYDTKLADIMQPVTFIPESARLNTVFVDFFERRRHLFVVVDEYGGVTGVISMEDIIEEIIGREIVDESDRELNMRELARRDRRQMIRTDDGERRKETAD
jgi:CBS domain containing-hemolysin-like protein